MIKILVLLIAVLLIAAIIWWFFGRHQEKAVAADVSADSQNQKVKVEVNGGYSPSTIVLKKAYRQNWIFIARILHLAWNGLSFQIWESTKNCHKISCIRLKLIPARLASMSLPVG